MKDKYAALQDCEIKMLMDGHMKSLISDSHMNPYLYAGDMRITSGLLHEVLCEYVKRQGNTKKIVSVA